MNKQEAKKIINDESLENYNWYEEHDIRINEVGIIEHSNKWSVYTADERAFLISQEFYGSESDALDDFIERLRADKLLREL